MAEAGALDPALLSVERSVVLALRLFGFAVRATVGCALTVPLETVVEGGLVASGFGVFGVVSACERAAVGGAFTWRAGRLSWCCGAESTARGEPDGAELE